MLTKMTCNGLNGLFLFPKFMFFLKNFDYKSSCCDLDSMNSKRMNQILSIKDAQVSFQSEFLQVCNRKLPVE